MWLVEEGDNKTMLGNDKNKLILESEVGSKPT